MELFTNFDYSSFNFDGDQKFLELLNRSTVECNMQKKKFKKLIQNFIAGRLSRKKAKNIQAL